MTETKPEGMTPAESWAWDNTEPGSWQRQAMAFGKALQERPQPASGATGYERAELRAVLPGKHGLECIFYQYLHYKTLHLRREVYITFATEGVEFRPASNEHTPHGELLRYQMKAGMLAGTGEESYGRGRPLEVVFACYCEAGSGAADGAVRAIRDALEELRDVARLPDGERSKFGFRHGMKSALVKMREQVACYRPPADALPYRAGPPEPARRSEDPSAPRVASFGELVNGLLEAWGHGDLADERRAERRRPRAGIKSRAPGGLADRAPAGPADPFDYGAQQRAREERWM